MYGKLGLGLAGAIATVGLMSAGVQMVDAQIVMTPPGTNFYPGSNNPYISSAETGDDTWAYVIGLENPSASGSSTNVYLLGSGTYQGNFTIGGFSGYISGSAVIPTDWSVGYSSNVLTLTYSGPTITATPGETVALGTFYFSSLYGPSTIGTFSSSAATATESSPSELSPDTNFTHTQVPNASTPAAPLPLPPEFWPSVLTLAGMAAVGGLRLRNRAL
jgi:hypothetical protein